MTRRIPPFLRPGDTIGIVATARWIEEDQLRQAVETFESWGFRVRKGKHLHTRHFQLAGTDAERAEDLQSMLNDSEIAAIIIARGGYGSIRIADRLDFSTFMKRPKWLCGYSDITVLHSIINGLEIASIHSTMPVSFPSATPAALENLRLALIGELRDVQLAGQQIPANTELTDLPVYGGNLSVIYSMLGSGSFEPAGDFILFIEDVDEMLYHLDRMMWALRRNPWFRRVKAIVCGGFTQMKDNTVRYGFSTDNPWGFDASEIVRGMGIECGIPVFSGFPAGHQEDNRAFYLGMPVDLKVNAGQASMLFQHQDRNKF